MSEPTIDFPSRPATEQASPNLPGIQSAYLGPANSASATASGGGGGGGFVVTTSFPGSPTDGEQFILTDNTATPTWYQWFQYNATAGIWLAVGMSRGTSLPSSPVEGQEAVLTDSLASPTWNWHFWYSTAASKWCFVGGSSVFVSAASGSSASGNGVWEDKGSVFTFAHAGLYQIETLGTMSGNSAASTSVYGLGFSNPPSVANITVEWNLSGAPGVSSGQFTATASQVLHAYFNDADSTRRNQFTGVHATITPITVT